MKKLRIIAITVFIGAMIILAYSLMGGWYFKTPYIAYSIFVGILIWGSILAMTIFAYRYVFIKDHTLPAKE